MVRMELITVLFPSNRLLLHSRRVKRYLALGINDEFTAKTVLIEKPTTYMYTAVFQGGPRTGSFDLHPFPTGSARQLFLYSARATICLLQ